MAATTSNHDWLCYYAARRLREWRRFHQQAYRERLEMIKRHRGLCTVYGGHYELANRPPDFDHFYRLEARSERVVSDVSLIKDYCEFHRDTHLGDIEFVEIESGDTIEVALPFAVHLANHECLIAIGTDGAKEFERCQETKATCEAEASAEPAGSTLPSTAGVADARSTATSCGELPKDESATRRGEGRGRGKVTMVTYENMDETGITPGTFEAIFDRVRRNSKK